MAKRSTAEIATGAIVLLVAFGFLGYAVANTGRGSVSGYELNARFDHIDGLGAGNDVRLAGVKVGSVIGTHIDDSTYQAVVNFSVESGLQLPKDTAAEITSDGLLGGKYLSLAPGGSTTMFQPGQTITITQGSVSLEQLLGKFIFSVTDMVSAVQQTIKPAAQGGSASGAGGGLAPLGTPK
jgi:phospholipid/cholesterol/gamma-HCH transport system substrate-binding protein